MTKQSQTNLPGAPWRRTISRRTILAGAGATLGGVVWQTRVTPAGPLGGVEGTSGVAGGRAAVPATSWPIPSGPGAGGVERGDEAGGWLLSRRPRTAPVALPTAVGDDLPFQSEIDGVLGAAALADGRALWQADLGDSVSGGIAIVALGLASAPGASPGVSPVASQGA